MRNVYQWQQDDLCCGGSSLQQIRTHRVLGWRWSWPFWANLRENETVMGRVLTVLECLYSRWVAVISCVYSFDQLNVICDIRWVMPFAMKLDRADRLTFHATSFEWMSHIHTGTSFNIGAQSCVRQQIDKYCTNTHTYDAVSMIARVPLGQLVAPRPMCIAT